MILAVPYSIYLLIGILNSASRVLLTEIFPIAQPKPETLSPYGAFPT